MESSYFLARLNDQQLVQFGKVLKLVEPYAPELVRAICECKTQEVERRLVEPNPETLGPPREPQPLSIPAEEWTGKQLAAALRISHALSYGDHRNLEVGLALDHLSSLCVVAAAQRLETLDK